MAVFNRSERSLFQRLGLGSRRQSSDDDADVRRLERRYRDALEAMNGWTSLLRDLEHEGQTSDARYDRYFQAYLDAQRQLKRAELDLFNVRHVRAR